MARRICRTASVLVGVVVLGLPASASAATSYSLSTSAVGPDGYATASGSVSFIDRDSVTVTSTVADRCGRGSGDGEGAYLWLEIDYTNGAEDRKLSLNWDNDGCDNGGRGKKTATFNPGVPIKRVRIRLDEGDGPSAPSETVYSTWRDNPHT